MVSDLPIEEAVLDVKPVVPGLAIHRLLDPANSLGAQAVDLSHEGKPKQSTLSGDDRGMQSVVPDDIALLGKQVGRVDKVGCAAQRRVSPRRPFDLNGAFNLDVDLIMKAVPLGVRPDRRRDAPV